MKKNLLVLLILYSSGLLQAQKEDTAYKYWMTIGFFFDADVTLNLSYNFALGENFYKVSYQKKGDAILGGGFNHSDFLFREIDISIGKRLQFEWFQASLFTGPSYVYGKRRFRNSRIEKFDTVGLETDIQLLFRPANEIGLGIGLYGSLNFIKNYAGININLTFGNGK